MSLHACLGRSAVLAVLALGTPAFADPTDSLPEACDGLLGLSFPAGVRVWDGTDEQAGFIDYAGGSVHWADNWWPGQGVPGATDAVALGIHPCLQIPGGQLLAFGDFAGAQDPVPSPGADLVTSSLTVYGGRFDIDLGGQTYSALAYLGSLRVGVTSPFGASSEPADLRFTGGGLFDARDFGARGVIGESQPGSVTASGIGTALVLPDDLDIGIDAPGSLRVDDGAHGEVAGRLNLGGAGGSVIVSGVGTTFSAPWLDVGGLHSGHPGPGSLLVEQGAHADVRMLVAPTGTVTIRDEDTLVRNELHDVKGTMLVEGGARVEGGLVVDGGEVTLAGAGTSLVVPSNSSLSVDGLLRIEDGARISGRTTAWAGSFVVAGEDSELAGPLSLRGAVDFRVEAGAVYRGYLRMESSDSVFELAGGAGVPTFGPFTPMPGVLQVAGLQNPGFGGVGTIVADVVTSDTWFQPSFQNSVGTLSIRGDLSVAGASNRLLMELDAQGGIAINDRITVDGHVDVSDATLLVSFLGTLAELDATVAPEDEFVLLEGTDPIEGVLRLLSGETLASGDLFEVNVLFGPFPRGPRYFEVFYGPGSPYGANRVVLTGFTAVPEPATVLLVGAGLAAAGARRRR